MSCMIPAMKIQATHPDAVRSDPRREGVGEEGGVLEDHAALRTAIGKGREDVAMGRVLDGPAAFELLKAKHFPDR